MPKRRGNPDWGRPHIESPYHSASSFEEVVEKLQLSPVDYESSIALKDWVRKNKDRKYVPLSLLQTWRLDS